MTWFIYLTELSKIYYVISFHMKLTCDHRDPLWINSSIRRLIQDKNEAYKRFIRSNNDNQYIENFQSLQNLLEVSIEASK